MRWIALYIALAALFAFGVLAEDESPPEVQVACDVVREGKTIVKVVCTTTPLTHLCRVRGMAAETSPAIPGQGARSTLTLYCPGRMSTGLLDTELTPLANTIPCRWNAPAWVDGKLAYACIDSPGSRNRKLGRFEIPGIGRFEIPAPA